MSRGPVQRILNAIVEAATAAEYGIARTLFEEYAADIGIDLCFQTSPASSAPCLPCMGRRAAAFSSPATTAR